MVFFWGDGGKEGVRMMRKEKKGESLKNKVRAAKKTGLDGGTGVDTQGGYRVVIGW